MKISELKNKKIAILWYWLEWKSTEKFLKRLGLKYTILDKNLDKNYLNKITSFDLIFKSPWISPYNNLELLKVSEKLTSQVEILADNFDWKIIWITGTKGKSTISTLLYFILKELWYKVKLVWNIWNPVLDEIDIISWEKYDYIVYELSSYMLEWLELNIFIWLLNNIYDCHLDWHNGRDNYELAKFNIFKASEYKLVNYELKNNSNLALFKKIGIDFFGLEWQFKYKNNIFYIDNKEFILDKDIALKWEHNRKNISWIFGILDKILKLENKDIFDKNIIKSIKKVLKKFSGLSHRQENIWTHKWITFINDSIATTPESTIAAIKTFWENIWTIFIWNEDSGFNLTKLRDTIEKYKIPNIVLFPSTWEKLFWDFSKNIDFDLEVIFKKNNFEIKLFKTLSMQKWVEFAYKNTQKWKIVLLSTWAPSFNANWTWVMPWKWFIQKGEMFKKYVIKYSK